MPNRTYGSHAHQKPCGPAAADSGPHFQHVADPVSPSVDPAYAKSLYEGLPADKRQFDFAEVEKLAQDAHLWYKERKFRPSMGERLTGYAPSQSVYNPM